MRTMPLEKSVNDKGGVEKIWSAMHGMRTTGLLLTGSSRNIMVNQNAHSRGL